MRRILWIPRLLASRHLTLALLGSAAASMAAITLVEARESTGVTPHRLYLSPPFVALLALVWLNLLSNAVLPSWWRISKLPGIAAHLGFVLILTGGFLTWQLGIRGTLPIAEGESSAEFLVDDPVLRLESGRGADRQVHALRLGPGGWFLPGSLLEVLPLRRRAAVAGAGLVEVLERSPSSRSAPALRAGGPGEGRPAVIVDLADGTFRRRIGIPAGRSVEPGSSSLPRISFDVAAPGADPSSLLASRLGEWIEVRPPTGDPIRVPVSLPADSGKERVAGDWKVTVLEYHPDFQVGRAPEPADPPRNPAVRVRIEGPSGTGTAFAFALHEDFHGRAMEDGTTVAYHRPAAGAVALVLADEGRFLASSDPAGPAVSLSLGRAEALPGAPGRTIAVVEHSPAASLEEVALPETSGEGPPAFRVRLGEGGEPAWIAEGAGRATSRDGSVRATIARSYPLGFSVRLDDAVAEFWPASTIPKAYYSLVRIGAPLSPTGPEAPGVGARIETNAPLLRNGFRLYQSSMDQEPPHRWSGFAVAKDPGVPLVTVGFLVMTAGLLVLFSIRHIVEPLRARRREVA